MPGLIKSSICYEYSYPFGMINSIINYIFKYNICSDDSDITGGCEDIMDCEDLNTDIANILQQHMTINNSRSISSQSINYTFTGAVPGGDVPNQILVDLGNKGINVSQGDKNQEFGCNSNISQLSTEISANSDEMNDRISSEILNKINSKIDKHQEQLGYSPNAIATSVRNTMKNNNALLSHITTKTKSFIEQSQISTQKINYIDNYRKCGINDKGDIVGNNIAQKVDIKSISRNIVKTTIQQLMKNDVDLRYSTSTKITKVTSRIIFFSLLLNLIFGFLTYKLFTTKLDKKFKIMIYISVLITGMIILYAIKKESKITK